MDAFNIISSHSQCVCFDCRSYALELRGSSLRGVLSVFSVSSINMEVLLTSVDIWLYSYISVISNSFQRFLNNWHNNSWLTQSCDPISVTGQKCLRLNFTGWKAILSICILQNNVNVNACLSEVTMKANPCQMCRLSPLL